MTRTASPFFLRLALASALVFAIATAMLRSGVGPPVARDGLSRLFAAAQVAVGHPAARQAPVRAAVQPVSAQQASQQAPQQAPRQAAQPQATATRPAGPGGGDDSAGGDDRSGHGGSGSSGPGGG